MGVTSKKKLPLLLPILMVIFQVNQVLVPLNYSFSTSYGSEPLGYVAQVFYGMDALRVTRPVVFKVMQKRMNSYSEAENSRRLIAQSCSNWEQTFPSVL